MSVMQFINCVINFCVCGDQHKPRHLTVRVTDPRTANYFEGEHLKMNLKNTQYVDLEAKATSRLGGPAALDYSGVDAGWTGHSDTDAFTVGPNPDDPDNKAKCRVTANRDSPGSLDDIGVAHFEADGDLGEGVKSLIAEVAINVIPGDAEFIDAVAGTPQEQP